MTETRTLSAALYALADAIQTPGGAAAAALREAAGRLDEQTVTIRALRESADDLQQRIDLMAHMAEQHLKTIEARNAADDRANAEHEATTRMLYTACGDLAAIGSELGLAPEDAAAAPVIDAITNAVIELRQRLRRAEAELVESRENGIAHRLHISDAHAAADYDNLSFEGDFIAHLRDLSRDAARYRYLRTLDTRQFAVRYLQSISGDSRFDEMVAQAMHEARHE